MYGTTKEFLLRFGLKDLRDLPQLKDMSEVFGDELAQQLEGSPVTEVPPMTEVPEAASPEESAEEVASDSSEP
jgi:segregation and condensation protein B